MARHAYENSRAELYYSPDDPNFVSPEVIEMRLDDALRNELRAGLGIFAISKLTAEELVAQQEYLGDSVNTTRARLKELAIPLYEQIYFTSRGIATPQETKQSVGNIYSKTTSLIRQLSASRVKIPSTKESLIEHRKLTGAISEATFFALAIKRYRKSGPVPLPSSLEDDTYSLSGTREPGKSRTSFDFSLVDTVNLKSKPIKVQVKTSSYTGGRPYKDSILKISTQELAQGHYLRGKYGLPEALARDGSGHASNTDVIAIETAGTILDRRIQEHKDKLSRR